MSTATAKIDFYPGARWVEGPDFGFPAKGNHGRMGYPVRYIVVHGTASPGMNLDAWIRVGGKRGGVHFMIGRDGRIVQFLRISDASWGNGVFDPGHDRFWDTWKQSDGRVLNPNMTTVSIEHEKLTTWNSEQLTPAQAAASFKLIDWLCTHWGIPRKPADATGGITGHHSIEPVRRRFCPGPYPWAALYRFLGGPVSTTPPTPTITIHRELPGWESISEFPDRPGNHEPPIRSACWVAAYMPIAHSYWGKPLTGHELTRLYNDMVANHDMDGHGTSMSAGDRYARLVLREQTIYDPSWHYNSRSNEPEVIRQALMAQAGINGAILQLANAKKLPYNEGGVFEHFVGVGGIDGKNNVVRFALANGDDILGLAQHDGHGKTYAARWYTWDEILPAEPASLMAFAHPKQPSQVHLPQGWLDDGTVLLAPNHIPVTGSMRTYILANNAWKPDDVPQIAEHGDSLDSAQIFTFHELSRTVAGGVVQREIEPVGRLYVMALKAPTPPPPAPLPPPDPKFAAAYKAIEQIKPIVAAVA